MIPASFQAFRARTEAKSAWPNYPRRKRLAYVGALTVEFGAVFALAGWAIHRIDGDPAAPWVVLSGAASVPFMLLQFACWPRGALSRTLMFVPVWTGLWFVGMAAFIAAAR